MRTPKIKYLYKGKERTIPELERLTGVRRTTFMSRLKRGLSVDEALNAEDFRRYRNGDEPSVASVNRHVAEDRRRAEQLEKENRGYAKCVARINSK